VIFVSALLGVCVDKVIFGKMTLDKVRRKLKQQAALPTSDDLNERLVGIRKEWNSALQAAPNLPAFIHDSVQRDREKGEYACLMT
jgi:hypothetical protein